MKTVLSILAFVCLASTANAQETEKQKDIKTLLELTGSTKISLQVCDYMINTFKEMHPEIPQKFWDEFSKEITAEDFTQLIVPIYDKYYTHDEIKELIKFYNSPVGKKTVEVLPSITQESMTAGEAWGRKLAEKIIAKMEEEGY